MGNRLGPPHYPLEHAVRLVITIFLLAMMTFVTVYLLVVGGNYLVATPVAGLVGASTFVAVSYWFR